MTGPSLPTEASLYEAALSYLARYATTEKRLRQVLEQRIERWRRTAGDDETADKARAAISPVVARVVALGLVSDAVFAENRARALGRAGRSKRMIAATLAAKGVPAETARVAIAAAATDELIAALILARRRRIGPFRATEDGDHMKESGILARAGFPRDIVLEALGLDPEEAQARIEALRRGS